MLFVSLLFDVTSETWPESSANIRLLCPERKREVVSSFFLILMICVLLCRESALATDVCLELQTWTLLETIKLQK